MDSQAITRQKTRRGFNLIESAIVLGVVGAVIGGIWVAASAVNDHIKWYQLEKGWMYYLGAVDAQFDARTIIAREDEITAWLEASTKPPAGWKGQRWYYLDPATYRIIDPFGYSFGAHVRLYGEVPTFFFYTSKISSVPHCAHTLAVFGKYSKQRRIVHGTPSGCLVNSTRTVTDYAQDSSCCGSSSMGAWFAAR